MNKLLNVRSAENYLLYLEYSSGETRKLDMKPYLDFGVFAELKDIEIFNSVKISFDAIEWSNEVDLDPSFLLSKSELIV